MFQQARPADTPALSGWPDWTLVPEACRKSKHRATSGDATMGNPRHLHSDQGFVVHGLLYVWDRFAFMGLAVMTGVILASHVIEYATISFGVFGIVMTFVMVGIYLLGSFLLRQWRSIGKLLKPDRIPPARDLWDDQLDG